MELYWSNAHIKLQKNLIFKVAKSEACTFIIIDTLDDTLRRSIMQSTPHSLMNYIRDVIGAWKDDPRSDAELMARFTESRNEAAFKVLVGRHGAMVWRTCRGILGNTPDAEDVFQSTFFALTRKAGLFPVKSLAGWLHQVARRAALDIEASARRRRNLERKIQTTKQLESKEDGSQLEQYRVMDEELARLPEKLRIPLVLRYLERFTVVLRSSYRASDNPEAFVLTGCGQLNRKPL